MASQVWRAVQAWFRGLPCALFVALFVAPWLLLAGPVMAAPDYRFTSTSPSAGAPGTAFSQQALSADELAFIKALPEIRVGLPTPPTEPYESIGPDGEISGIHAQMLVALARTFGLRLKPVVLPDWSATLQAARDGL